MKLLLSLLMVLSFSIPLFATANPKAVVVTYKYKKAGSKTQAITFGELQQVYTLTKRQTPFYPPAPSQFFKDYLRFKLGSEVALNDKSLVKSPNLLDMIVNPYLREGVRQEVYKALAETKLQKQNQNLIARTRKLSDKQLKSLYARNPQYNFFYISIDHPLNANKKQVAEASKRAVEVYQKVVKSKKPFPELISLYSDNKQAGMMSWNQTKATIHPSIYKALQRMSNGSIGKPIKVASGYVIVKLNQKIPYSKNIHEPAIKENYYAEKRTEAFNKYMDGLQKNFTITYKNRSLINKLK